MAESALERAARLERELAEAVDAARKETGDAVDGAEIPGVRRLGPNAFVVKSSMLGNSWSPDYFDAEGQKRRIHEKLSKASTLSGLKSALRSMLSDRQLVLHPEISKVLENALADIENAGNGK